MKKLRKEKSPVLTCVFDSILKSSNACAESDQCVCQSSKYQMLTNLIEGCSPHSRRLGSLWLPPCLYGTLLSLHGFLLPFLLQLGTSIGKDFLSHTGFLVSRMLGISAGHSLSMCFV